MLPIGQGLREFSVTKYQRMCAPTHAPTKGQFFAIGNGKANEHAKAARALHLGEPQAKKDLLKEAAQVKHICQTIGATLALWPRLPKGMPRVPKKGPKDKSPPALRTDLHAWSDERVEGLWRCHRCGTYALGDED